MSDTKLPDDVYSTTLRGWQGNPQAVERASTIDLRDFYGNEETWIVRTIRATGRAVVFLQRVNAAGGERWVLPPEVTEAIARQRESAVAVSRQRGAHAAAATRKATAAKVGK